MSVFGTNEAYCIIDTGANMGLATALFASACAWARKDALEVHGNNARLLRFNAAQYDGLRVIDARLWRQAGFIMILNPEASSLAFQADEPNGDDFSAVTASGVEDLLQQKGPCWVDFQKVDTEGAKREVFAPLAAQSLGEMPQLATELHDLLYPGCSAAVTQSVSQRRHTRTQCSASSDKLPSDTFTRLKTIASA